MQTKEYEKIIQSLEQLCCEGAYEQAKNQAFHYYQLAAEEKMILLSFTCCAT